MMKRLSVVLVASCLLAVPASSLEIDPDGLFVRVIDVGNGHAAVVRMPGEFFMVYDTGFGRQTLDGVRSVIPPNKDVDLLVLSHTDRDHIGGTNELLDTYRVKEIVRPGLKRDTNVWREADAAIAEEKRDGASVLDLSKSPLPQGYLIEFGRTRVVFVSGFSSPPRSWGTLGSGERENAGSIVVRLDFGGRSILFAGDAVGLKHCKKKPCEKNRKIFATEKFMVDNAQKVRIDSDVLIAPHHGSKDSSSREFIDAVSPKWVIIPAGRSSSDHPHREAAERYLEAGVCPSMILRTDLHDDEGDKEWACGRIDKHKDEAGDDDVDIVISSAGSLKVAYRHEALFSLSRCHVP